ncbi:hypothetical protein RFI_15975 [Reticulomyxa filosa]|uniref:PX domain-containing protein n=1 Tax=Reticulomyxa filosa TaxID=46433 RepID=X6N638_RETFI|nr:hypothetical protein RFI_15975 [Reticulomyxa filosa]|eukprot:ETO21229.1 hypothetical protein RFI_15975 [Reticulomyxa filosa]
MAESSEKTESGIMCLFRLYLDFFFRKGGEGRGEEEVGKKSVSQKQQQQQKKGARKFPTIMRAELAGGYFNKFVVFVIETPKGETILRRYTDFEWLRSWLVALYPGAFIPPIPPKLPVTMWPAGYLLSRKKELQQFLQRIQIIRYLESEEIVKFFLQSHDHIQSPNKEADLTNNSASFEKARKSWDSNHKKPSFNAQFENLCQKFPGGERREKKGEE